MSSDGWMDKDNVYYVCMWVYAYKCKHTYMTEYYSAIKKENIALMTRCMELEGIYAKWNKTDKDEYCMILLRGAT